MYVLEKFKLTCCSLSNSVCEVCFLFFSFSVTKTVATIADLHTRSSWQTLRDTMKKAEPAAESCNCRELVLGGAQEAEKSPVEKVDILGE